MMVGLAFPGVSQQLATDGEKLITPGLNSNILATELLSEIVNQSAATAEAGSSDGE